MGMQVARASALPDTFVGNKGRRHILIHTRAPPLLASGRLPTYRSRANGKIVALKSAGLSHSGGKQGLEVNRDAAVPARILGLPAEFPCIVARKPVFKRGCIPIGPSIGRQIRIFVSGHAENARTRTRLLKVDQLLDCCLKSRAWSASAVGRVFGTVYAGHDHRTDHFPDLRCMVAELCGDLGSFQSG
jgi:hypothetical protein